MSQQSEIRLFCFFFFSYGKFYLLGCVTRNVGDFRVNPAITFPCLNICHCHRAGSHASILSLRSKWHSSLPHHQPRRSDRRQNARRRSHRNQGHQSRMGGCLAFPLCGSCVCRFLVVIPLGNGTVKFFMKDYI